MDNLYKNNRYNGFIQDVNSKNLKILTNPDTLILTTKVLLFKNNEINPVNYISDTLSRYNSSTQRDETYTLNNELTTFYSSLNEGDLLEIHLKNTQPYVAYHDATHGVNIVYLKVPKIGNSGYAILNETFIDGLMAWVNFHGFEVRLDSSTDEGYSMCIRCYMAAGVTISLIESESSKKPLREDVYPIIDKIYKIIE